MAQRKDPEKKIIEAALALAADKPWADFGMTEIAKKAKVPLGELRQLFGSRTAILVAFMRRIDREVLDARDEGADESGPRDRVFDIVMRRLELLEPHKQAMRNIVEGVRNDPTAWPWIAGTTIASQRWMLIGAGLEPSGARGEIRVRGLAMVYWSALRTWLDDDDPGMARTMSVLDRQLRRGETWLKRIDGPVMLLGGMGALARSVLRRTPKTAKTVAPESAE